MLRNINWWLARWSCVNSPLAGVLFHSWIQDNPKTREMLWGITLLVPIINYQLSIITSAFLRNEADAQGQAHQTRHIMDVEAAHQLDAMVFDGLGADLEDVGDAFGILAFGNELENFALAGCQLFERAFPDGDSFQWKHPGQPAGNFLAEVNLPLHHPAQGGGQFRRGRHFEQVAGCAR